MKTCFMKCGFQYDLSLSCFDDVISNSCLFIYKSAFQVSGGNNASYSLLASFLREVTVKILCIVNYNLYFIRWVRDASFRVLWLRPSHPVNVWFHTCRTFNILYYSILNMREGGFVTRILKQGASQHSCFTLMSGKPLFECLWSALKVNRYVVMPASEVLHSSAS